MIKNIERGSAKVLVIVLLLLVLAGTGYFMFSGTKESPRSKRISKRVKIVLPPPVKPTAEPKKDAVEDIVKAVPKVEDVKEQTKDTEAKSYSSLQKPKGVLPPDKLEQSITNTRKPVAKITKEISKRIVSQKKKTVVKFNKPWAINLISTGSNHEADELAKKINAAGYNAYVTRFQSNEGSIWFRLRVGFFSSRSEAERTASKISKKFGTRDYWVVKPGVDEIKKFIR